MIAANDIPKAYTRVRIYGRVVNAFSLQSELLVLCCFISETGASEWQSMQDIERRVRAELEKFRHINLLRPVQYYIYRFKQQRLIEQYRGQYRLTDVGAGCILDHTARLERHNARGWNKVLVPG